MEQFYDGHLYKQKSLAYEIEIFRDDQMSKKQSFVSNAQMPYNEKTNKILSDFVLWHSQPPGVST